MDIPISYPFPWTPPMEIPGRLRHLREKSVVDVALPNGDTALLVTRYKDVLSLLADDRLSRDIARPDAARICKDNDQFADRDIDPDPPEHTRVRRLVTRALTPGRVAALRPVTREITGELLDTMAAGPRPADLNTALAYPLPIRVICTLFGVPRADIKGLHGLVAGFLPLTSRLPEQVRQCRLDLREFLDELIQSKRVSPGDDLISDLLQVSDDGGKRLNEHELAYWLEGLLMAGFGSTASQLGTGTALLLHRRELVDQIRADWSLIPSAVEELLRMHLMGSSIGTMRYAVTDIDLSDGTVIKKGSSVLMSVESANMDEGVFDDPFTIDIRRADNKHLTFGAGPHCCVGAELARMELQVATDCLLRRFPDIRLAVPGEELLRGVGGFLEGFSQIPVTW